MIFSKFLINYIHKILKIKLHILLSGNGRTRQGLHCVPSWAVTAIKWINNIVYWASIWAQTCSLYPGMLGFLRCIFTSKYGSLARGRTLGPAKLTSRAKELAADIDRCGGGGPPPPCPFLVLLCGGLLCPPATATCDLESSLGLGPLRFCLPVVPPLPPPAHLCPRVSSTRSPPPPSARR
jgi:hypothetical protein